MVNGLPKTKTINGLNMFNLKIKILLNIEDFYV